MSLADSPDRHIDKLRRGVSQIADIHREHFPGAGNQLCAQFPAETGFIERSRHQEQAEVRPEDRLGFPGKRQGQVRLQAAFMEFVENDEIDAVQSGIFDQHPRQDAFCQHLDPRPAADFLFETDAVADRLPHLLAEQRSHPCGNLTCRNAAGLQHQDYSGTGRARGQDGQRQPGGFSRARRRRHNGHRAGGE